MKIQRFPDWALALTTGVLFGITYLPIHLEFLIYISLVPILFIWLKRGLKTSAAMTYLAAITANTVAFYWMGLNKGTSAAVAFASLAGSVFYLSIFWLIVGICVTFLQRKLKIGLLLFPFVWVLMEYIRSFGPMGFPWADIALTQLFLLPLVQSVDITGTAGLAFFVCIINGLFFLSIVEKKTTHFIIGALVLWFTLFGFGSLRLNQVENISIDSSFKVAIIQPNVDPVRKWERSYKKSLVNLMDSLTVEAMNLKPDLVIWPESALPAYLRISSRYRTPILKLVVKNKVPLLAGTIDMTTDENGRHYFNGAILFKEDSTTEIYHKLKLVPFAEYIPFSEPFPIVKKLNFGQGNFEHGNDYTVFKVNNRQFGNLICYESSYPRIVRKFIQRGAEFLTIETNDAWSGDAPGVYQHFGLARLRAIENRVPVARSANTGLSGIITPSGRVSNKLDFYRQGIIFGSLIFLTGHWNTVSGEIFVFLCIFTGLGIVILEWIKKQS